MMEKKVTMMPCSLFYDFDSPHKETHIVRMGICRGMKDAMETIERLAE